jgi:Alpha amylase, catalytic domain
MPHMWWQVGTIYQVYPRSFQDSNGDGIGDLDGIRQRLDYLVWLGVDAIWISPVYPSPMYDFGYDVTDYCGIDPIFGSLESFDLVIDEAHTKQLKVILDFVPNHTSIEHPCSSPAGGHAPIQNATGISGGMRPQMADPRIIGSATLAAAPGHGMKPPVNTTTTPILLSSRI